MSVTVIRTGRCYDVIVYGRFAMVITSEAVLSMRFVHWTISLALEASALHTSRTRSGYCMTLNIQCIGR